MHEEIAFGVGKAVERMSQSVDDGPAIYTFPVASPSHESFQYCLPFTIPALFKILYKSKPISLSAAVPHYFHAARSVPSEESRL